MPTLEHRVLNGVKQIQNPINGKWVNASGEAGRKLIGNDICQLYPREKEFVPLEHQARVAKYFIESPYRGLLLSWSLGYGKSAGYAMVIDAYLLNPKNNKNVIK